MYVSSHSFESYDMTYAILVVYWPGGWGQQGFSIQLLKSNITMVSTAYQFEVTECNIFQVSTAKLYFNPISLKKLHVIYH